MSTFTNNPLSWKEPDYYEVVSLSEAAVRYNTTYSVVRNYVKTGKLRSHQVRQTRLSPLGKEIQQFVEGTYAPLLPDARTRLEQETKEAFDICLKHFRFYVAYMAARFNLVVHENSWQFLLRMKDLSQNTQVLRIQHLRAAKIAIIDFDKNFFALGEGHQITELALILATCYFESFRSQMAFTIGETHSLLYPFKEIEEKVAFALVNTLERASQLEWAVLGELDKMYPQVRFETEI